MTVPITVGEGGPVLRILVEGRLSADAVGELEQVVESQPCGVILDLSNLLSSDVAGLAALRRLRAAGAAIQGARPHLAWRIYEAHL